MKERDVLHSETISETPGQTPVVSALKQVAPIVMGYLPVGAAFGVLAHKTGLSMTATVLMSLMVYAGSAQLIAVAMFAAGLPPLSIVATTFVVNLRHLLMSASLAPNLKGWRKWQLLLFSYEITDESFAIHSVRFARGDKSRTVSICINCFAHASWVIASWLGFMTGSAIPDIKPLGIDYALPAMFIALLAMQIKNGLHVFVAGFSGLAAIALIQMGADQWSVILATVLGATFGAGVETWKNK
ncbi:MAG: branched-chain amino acid ABC transporter permease [Desulfovibrio sp.]|nr:branched-chain amino acid ABC transporter permease [Desulfovibrio sp.]